VRQAYQLVPVEEIGCLQKSWRYIAQPSQLAAPPVSAPGVAAAGDFYPVAEYTAGQVVQTGLKSWAAPYILLPS